MRLCLTGSSAPSTKIRRISLLYVALPLLAPSALAPPPQRAEENGSACVRKVTVREVTEYGPRRAWSGLKGRGRPRPKKIENFFSLKMV